MRAGVRPGRASVPGARTGDGARRAGVGGGGRRSSGLTDAVRPPYRHAIIAGVAVLVAYLFTLAPSVTFWDAGEFIAAARTLGIPHPPGTPLVVLMASVWGRIVPVGGYAWRINLLSAVASALAAGCWYLVAHDALRRIFSDIDAESQRALATLGAFAAALLGAFTFTNWQNSNETEVYAIASLAMALVAWAVTRWRAMRNDGAAWLLFALYIGALSIGVHLMALLIGPAMIGAMMVESRRTPLADAVERQVERTRIAVAASGWLLLIGIGLATGWIVVIAATALGVSMAHARRGPALRFGWSSLLVMIIGVSTLLFLVLRARQHPWLDQGNPSTWHAVIGALRRVQYPVRTPFDDPMVLHGSGNPGRSLTLLGYQLANYAQYFDWQWAASIGTLARASVPRLLVTLLMATIGIRGARAQRRADPASFTLIAALFLLTGPGLVVYLNFKPGPSIGWNLWHDLAVHEVRDRDYFFVASFIAWSVWVAIGLAVMVRDLAPRLAVSSRRAAAVAFALALVPLALNWHVADRRHSAEATLARDYAHALLASAPPHSVLLTWGDNDTFPLWYAQTVEGYRPDVTVFCLALHPPLSATVDSVIAANAGLRPVAWSTSATDGVFGRGPLLIQQDLALVLPMDAPTSGLRSAAPFDFSQTRFDAAATRGVIAQVGDLGALERQGHEDLDGGIQWVAALLAAPMTRLAEADLQHGDTTGATALLRRAVRVGDDSSARAVLARLHP